MGKVSVCLCDLSRNELENVVRNLQRDNEKLEEELKITKSENHDLKDLVIKLNMKMFLEN